MFYLRTGRELQRRKPRKIMNVMKSLAVTTCLGLGLSINTAYAEDSTDFQTIFHVYIDGEHIGKVNNQDVVQDIVEQKMKQEKESYENLNLTIAEDIELISEKVFDTTTNNELVIKTIDENITVMAEAFELQIADKTVGYFEDEESADKVINAYKMKYVDEEILEKIEANKQEDEQLDSTLDKKEQEDVSPKLGETLVTDVALSEELSFEEASALPSEILSVEQGLTLLEKGTLEEKVHKVKEGEVLGAIASEYDLTTEKLLALNPELTEDTLLQIGQEINVVDYKPFVNVIVKGEKRVEETIPFETEIIESEALYKGEEQVKQDGKDGMREVQYAIEKVNGKQTSKDIIVEDIKEEAVNKIIVKGTKVISSRGTGDLTWPTVGGYISSHLGERWGRMHKGIDIARPTNRNILSVDTGVVEAAGYAGGLGNRVIINHNNGMKTIYGHLSSIDVSVGQTVEKGHKIGIMGSTGNSTGVHLHLELYMHGKLKNPLDYL